MFIEIRPDLKMNVNSLKNYTVMDINHGLSPLVSIIIPTYNREKTIERAINSVLSQTYQIFEIIIVDDNSTDSTISLIRKYENNEPRIHHMQHHKNLGAQAARNTGIKAARGEWIAFLDSDDEWLPNRIHTELSLANELGVFVVHSECYVKQENSELKQFGVPKLSGNIYIDLLQHPGPMFQGLLVKKECLERINYLDETIISYQEWDTSIRLAKFYPFAYVEEPLFIYHLHKGETISKDAKRGVDGWSQIVKKYHEEIIRGAGFEALLKHYQILATQYYTIKDYQNYRFYYQEIMANTEGSQKLKFKLKFFLKKMHINPGIVDININQIIKYLKRKIALIRLRKHKDQVI
jgi:glycosyltransferase involved in cell wall biosynthesis